MHSESRKYGLGIWALALGYFVFYTPYSALIKAITTASSTGSNHLASGFELLPSVVIATAVTMFGTITAIGWWKHAGRRQFFGLSVPFPSGWLILSGFATAIIIGTTTLAYTFSGISIVFALILLRGGVLILAPVVDAVFKRRVRWFSWCALALSFLALAVALADVNNYKMTLVAALNTGAYLTGYMLRLPCMTRFAKSGDENSARRYFVEEQMAAMPALVAIPAIFALIGRGHIMMELRHGFTIFWGSSLIIPALMIGSLYAALCVCGTLVYLDRRENTFCIPLNRCSSLLSGIVATYALFFLYSGNPPSISLLTSAGLITVALLFLSPLHHFDRYLRRFNQAMAQGRLASRLRAMGFDVQTRGDSLSLVNPVHPETTMASGKPQRVFLFVCSGNTCRSAMAEAIGNAEVASRLRIPLASLGTTEVEMLSAGISARPGAPMTAEAQTALRHLGLPVPEHTTRVLTPEMIRQAEVVYCMTEEHRRSVIQMFPAAASKTKCIDPNSDIEDPIGAGLEKFVSCAKRLQDLVRFRFDELGLQAAP